MKDKKFRLTIIFHGSIGFVPDGDEMIVLVPLFDDVGEGLEPLTPYVRFNRENWDFESNNRNVFPNPCAKKCQSHEHHHEAGGFCAVDSAHTVLKAEYLEIVAAFSETSLCVNNRKDKYAQTPTAYDLESIYWLPNIGRIAPGSATIHPDYLCVPLPSVCPSVAGRLDLTKGHLKTSGALRTQIDFVDENTGTVTRHAIARDAIFTADIEDDSFLLRSRSLKDGKHYKDLDMRFILPRYGNEITIVVGNEPRADIYEPPPSLPTDEEAKQAAKEFGLYYGLCKYPPDPPPGPVPSAKYRPGLHQFCANGVYEGPTGG